MHSCLCHAIGDRKRYRAAVNAMAPSTSIERRPVTIMFVDLEGSSALGERLDPEDMMEVIRQYRDRCGIAVARYGGKIARFVGDGIKAYFCYPVANENDPERACRAATEIVRAVEGFSTPDGQPIHVRIGLATGIVIVGDLIAGGETEV
jgi:class 3 adenylate cyclase